MTNAPNQDSIRLQVADFGPIAEAHIDLRPLTVFVGPSNTGKSYLAILIYALHHFFNDGSGWGSRRSFHRGSPMHWNIKPRRLTKKAVEDLNGLAQQILKQSTSEGQVSLLKALNLPASIKTIDLPDSVEKAIRAGLSQGNNSSFGPGISRCFGLGGGGTEALIRSGNADSARITFQKHVPNVSDPIKHELVIGTKGTKFSMTIPEEMPLTPLGIDEKNFMAKNMLYLWAEEMILEARRTGKDKNIFSRQLLSVLSSIAMPELAAPLHFPVHYLPANRTGLMHAYNAAVSTFIRRAAEEVFDQDAPTLMPALPGVLTDFLQGLNELDQPTHQRNKRLYALAGQIEKKVLGGAVSIEKGKATGFPNLVYKPRGWEGVLPLGNASSMVSELAPVVQYLRYLVQPDNVLIIEEPEAHLHPAMQVEFTRQIAAMVQAGVRVIVTTHSEWLLEKLANIVQRAELPESRQKKSVGGDIMALHHSQVGVWLFRSNRRLKGTVVKEIKLERATGLFPDDYDEVSEALYNESARIFNSIQGPVRT